MYIANLCLIETRQIASATLAQAMVPLFQLPAFLTFSSALLHVEPLPHDQLAVLWQLCLAFSPLLNALITIACVKQYRKHVGRLFCGAACCSPQRSSLATTEAKALATFAATTSGECRVYYE